MIYIIKYRHDDDDHHHYHYHYYHHQVRKALTHAEKMKKHKLVTDIFEARKS
jgi:molybdopterin-guanine dinucleotide biosynthesis protein A